jgi:hypothetical protein
VCETPLLEKQSIFHCLPPQHTKKKQISTRKILHSQPFYENIRLVTVVAFRVLAIRAFRHTREYQSHPIMESHPNVRPSNHRSLLFFADDDKSFYSYDDDALIPACNCSTTTKMILSEVVSEDGVCCQYSIRMANRTLMMKVTTNHPAKDL